MHPAARRFIEVLKEDIGRWEKAASNIDELIPDLAGLEQKEQWKGNARLYRARAQELRQLMAKIEKEDWS